MAKTQSTAAGMPLFGRLQLDDEPEIRTTRAAVSIKRSATKHTIEAVDLAGKPKAFFLIGLGSTGKTTLARWIGWRMAEQGRQALLAALDPGNRSLVDWFEGVEQPETSDPNHAVRWLRDVLNHLMRQKTSALIDLGGGDTSLAKLVDLAPDIADRMSSEGVEPIACYCLGPRVDDLTPPQSLEESGSAPRSTLLVLNEGRVDSVLTREEAFARVTRHSDFLGLVARGAVPVWMPRLEPEVAGLIEGRRLTFGMARDGQVPEGARFAPIGGLERSMIARWLERMEQEFRPVSSWMP